MNQIQAKFEKSEYNDQPHLTINIDGNPLDKILHELYPDKNLIGLVPTLLDWLSDHEERTIVWERFESNQKQIVPILMCPDDVDLWCVVINVEIEKTEHSVKWLRMGLDIGGPNNMPNSIGTNVEWFDKIEPYEFDKTSYEQFTSIFRNEIYKDEIKELINFWINRISLKEQIPKSVKAFNIGILETKDDYQTYLIGSNSYDLENDDWACEEDFVPKEKYLKLGENSKKWNWEEIQLIVKDGIEEFIQSQISPLTFIHKAEYLTTGFDDNKLLKIKHKISKTVPISRVTKDQKDKIKLSFWYKLKKFWS
ncbi:hypothetical protein [Tenacibaculum jejuense]|uniref:Uncharacterized protein n=1 Tax=Tenacibaculum jejuense TaxID=584609 RepID=A0A238U8G6_9FLAO|nr:hypothetical protein [Tenacibaculum jejuense]SNR14700.1 conserved protein of unknown function [Tenacibaculum jejuense]